MCLVYSYSVREALLRRMSDWWILRSKNVNFPLVNGGHYFYIIFYWFHIFVHVFMELCNIFITTIKIYGGRVFNKSKQKYGTLDVPLFRASGIIAVRKTYRLNAVPCARVDVDQLIGPVINKVRPLYGRPWLEGLNPKRYVYHTNWRSGSRLAPEERRYSWTNQNRSLGYFRACMDV